MSSNGPPRSARRQLLDSPVGLGEQLVERLSLGRGDGVAQLAVDVQRVAAQPFAVRQGQQHGRLQGPIRRVAQDQLHALLGEVVAMLDTPPDAPPVVVESADGAVAATPIDDAPRFRVALLRDVPDGARVAPFPSDNDDHETAADSLNVGRALPRDFYWDTAAVCRDGHGPTTPCIVDSRPEATGSTTEPYCACGRRVSECDQSRAGCAKARC